VKQAKQVLVSQGLSLALVSPRATPIDMPWAEGLRAFTRILILGHIKINQIYVQQM